LDFVVFPEIVVHRENIFGMAPGQRRDTEWLTGERD